MTVHNYIKDLRPAEWGLRIILRSSNSARRMSERGQTLAKLDVRFVTAFHPIATKSQTSRYKTVAAYHLGHSGLCENCRTASQWTEKARSHKWAGVDHPARG